VLSDPISPIDAFACNVVKIAHGTPRAWDLDIPGQLRYICTRKARGPCFSTSPRDGPPCCDLDGTRRRREPLPAEAWGRYARTFAPCIQRTWSKRIGLQRSEIWNCGVSLLDPRASEFGAGCRESTCSVRSRLGSETPQALAARWRCRAN